MCRLLGGGGYSCLKHALLFIVCGCCLEVKRAGDNHLST